MCNLPERNFLVTLVSLDDPTQEHAFVLKTPCVCDIHDWVMANAEMFPIANPRVKDVDDKAAYHLPLRSEVSAAS